MEKKLLNSDKELLLIDLCARLPYGVKAHIVSREADRNVYVTEDNICHVANGWWKECKPYLFPLSSMTSKQKAELSMLVVGVEDIFKAFLIEVEFYHKHHIDYRGLIPMGLANDATNLNIY